MVTYADAPLTVVNPVATMPLAPTPSNAEIVTVSIELPPRDPGLPAHRHPGPVYGYMIEGEMVADLIPTFGSVNMIGGELDR